MVGDQPRSWYLQRGEPSNPFNYCPIALLSVMYKIFTKILNNRMMDLAERENLLSIAQGGFRREVNCKPNTCSQRDHGGSQEAG